MVWANSERLRVVPQVIEIDEPSDTRLDDFRDLTVADRRPDRPGGRGLVIAEGVVVVRRLLDSPYPPRAVFGVPSKVAEIAAEIADQVTAPCYVGSAQLLARVVGF